MNTTKYVAIRYLAISLAGLMLFTQVAYAGIAGRAQFINGNVQIANLAGRISTLQKGGAVNEGDTVISAKGASAQIKMQDGGFVAIRPDTQLKFDSFKFSGKEDGSEKLFFSLIKGGFRSVTGFIGRLNKPSYRITTAAATIGIRGTDHETYVVTPDSALANTAPTGTYNKVNVGETYLATDKGTIFVLPNQMGYAGAADQVPELKPLNTDLFTVAEKPTKEADDEGVEDVRDTATVDSTAETTEPDVASAPFMDEGSLEILQPITDTSGTDLSGSDTAPAPVVSAAYTPNSYLIELSGPSFYLRSYMAAPSDITFNGGAPYSSTDRDFVGGSSQTYSVIGASTTSITGAATSGSTGIQFGRWTNVTALEQTWVNQLGNTNWGTPTAWMYGEAGYLDATYGTPGAMTGAMAGTFSYVLDSQSAPIDRQSGQSGTLTSASLSVDFVNSLFSANLALTVGGQAWAASATRVAIFGSAFSAYAMPGDTFSNLTVTTGAGTPTLCPSCGGYLSGQFTGQNFAGAILSYNLWNDGPGGGDVSGLAAFARPAGAVTNSAPAPTGQYAVATDSDGGANIQMVSTLNSTTGLAPGGVLTSYGMGSPLQGFYSSTTVTGCTSCTAVATPTGIYYGTWNAGTLTNTYGGSIGPTSPLWISGPESGPIFLANALVGTKSFSFDGGMVVNSMGMPGLVLGTTTLTVDFTRQVVGINLDLSVPDTATGALHSWNATTLTGNEMILSNEKGLGGATFQAWSSQGSGPGTLTVTVDAGTIYAATVWGNLSGQLTGIGFTGAILSYNFDGYLPSSLTNESIFGVAALVSTASDIATAHRNVLISATTPNSFIATPTLGFYANAPSRMTTDAAGNLTQFDISNLNSNQLGPMTLSSGTSVLANAGNDSITGISWGRWDGGSINSTERSTGLVTPTALAGSLHWIAGPTETSAVTLPVSGTYTYINAGGTSPTDNLGNLGTLNSATLSANFTAQTVDLGVNVTVAGANLNAAAANVPIIQQTGFYADSQIAAPNAAHLAVTCTGTCGTTTEGAIFGEFSGAGATGAMMTYGLQTGSQVVSGVTAFHR